MKLNPYLNVIIAGIIFGTHGLFVKSIELPPTTVAFFRVAVPTIILFIYFYIKKINVLKVEKKLLLFTISLLFAFKVLFTMIGFQLSDINTSIIIFYSWPIFATIFSVIFLKEKIILRNIFLLFLAFSGIILIFSNQDFSLHNLKFLGSISMLIAAIIASLVIVLIKKISENNSKYKMIFYQNIVGTLIFLPFLFINTPFPNITQTITGISYGAVIGIMGFIFFFSALKKINVSTASHLLYIEIVSAIILGIIFYNEQLTWNIILGGTLIILSTIMLKK